MGMAGIEVDEEKLEGLGKSRALVLDSPRMGVCQLPSNLQHRKER